MRTIEEANELAKSNIGLLYYFAKQWRSSGFDLNERVSICGEALVKASRTFDETKGVKFSFWLGRHVSSMMLSAMRNIKPDHRYNDAFSSPAKTIPLRPEDFLSIVYEKCGLSNDERDVMRHSVEGVELKDSAKLIGKSSHQRVMQIKEDARYKIAKTFIAMNMADVVPNKWRHPIERGEPYYRGRSYDSRRKMENLAVSGSAA